MQIKQVGVQLYLRTLTTRQCPQSPAGRSCSNRLLYPAGRAHSSKPAAAGLLLCAHAGQTHERTPYPFVDLTPHTMWVVKKDNGSQYSITERRVPEMIPVLGSQPACDVSHKPDGRLPLLSAKPAVTTQPVRGLLPILLLCEQRHNGCEQFA